jgi:parallel beta-helix repeat protein
MTTIRPPARLAMIVTVVVAVTSPGQAAASGSRQVHIVSPGQSIQATIDTAVAGDTVILRPGTYRENLAITTDGLTLIGFGARLEAPPDPTPAGCVPAGQPSPVGICVSGGTDADGGRTDPVRDVTIRGLTVGRFPSTGIMVLHGQRTRIDRVDATGGAAYGILVLRSSDSTVTGSTLHGGQSAGLYIGESPEARSTVVGNRLYDNVTFGIYVRTASHGTIAGNQVEGSCIGIGFIPTDPAEDAVSDWRVTANRVTANNRLCQSASGPVTGIGVYLGGTKAITVDHNWIEANTGAAGTPPPWGGGIVMTDGSLYGFPNLPIDNRVHHNVLRDNLPFDIMVRVSGLRNAFTGNRCESSSPQGLC